MKRQYILHSNQSRRQAADSRIRQRTAVRSIPVTTPQVQTEPEDKPRLKQDWTQIAVRNDDRLLADRMASREVQHLGETARRSPLSPAQLSYSVPVQSIQAKLTIGQPNDLYEQEADRMAGMVVQQINAPGYKQSMEGESVDRKSQKVLRKISIQGADAIASGEASAELTSGIDSARGGGQPLDAGLQKLMGQAMGADFSGVRVHTDARSDQLNRSIQAKAFTRGQDVFFRQGEYQPATRGGQETIAHELTHVVQQSGGAVPSQPQEKNTVIKEIEATERGAKIQRKVGYEAESTGQWKIEIIKKDENGKVKKLPHNGKTNGPIYRTDKYKVEGDLGNLEFVTEPLENENEVKKTFDEMIQFLTDVKNEGNQVDIERGDTVAGKTWTEIPDAEQVRITTPGRQGEIAMSLFKPQATVDIPFNKMNRFVEEFSKKDNIHLVGDKLNKAMENVKKYTEAPIEAAAATPQIQGDEILGFKMMILSTLLNAREAAPNEEPKTSQALMHRVRYNEMYEILKNKLSEQGKGEEPLKQVLNDLLKLLKKENWRKNDNSEPIIFPEGYLGYNENTQKDETLQSPTVEQWFDSIRNPQRWSYNKGGTTESRESDLLSPPRGFRRELEGLGAYDLIDKKTKETKDPFFELRQFMNIRNNPKNMYDIKELAGNLIKLMDEKIYEQIQQTDNIEENQSGPSNSSQQRKSIRSKRAVEHYQSEETKAKRKKRK